MKLKGRYKFGLALFFLGAMNSAVIVKLIDSLLPKARTYKLFNYNSDSISIVITVVLYVGFSIWMITDARRAMKKMDSER